MARCSVLGSALGSELGRLERCLRTNYHLEGLPASAARRWVAQVALRATAAAPHMGIVLRVAVQRARSCCGRGAVPACAVRVLPSHTETGLCERKRLPNESLQIWLAPGII